MTRFMEKFKGMFKETNEDVEVGDIVSWENLKGTIEYARINQIDSVGVWSDNWVIDINEVDNKNSDKRVDSDKGNQCVNIGSIKEVFKKGKFKKPKLKPFQIKFLNNKRKRIIEEIEKNKDYSSCFKDITKEVMSWKSEVILNYKLGK